MANNNNNSLTHLRSLLITFQKIWNEALNGNYTRTRSGELTKIAKDIAAFPDSTEEKLSTTEKDSFRYAKVFANTK